VKILFVTPTSPIPAITGGRQRSNLLARALQAIGKVDTFLVRGEPDLTDEHLDILRRSYGLVGVESPQNLTEIGIWRHVRPIGPAAINRLVNFAFPLGRYTVSHPRLQAALERAVDLSRYDAIVCRYLSTAVAAGLLGKPRVVVDVDDMETSLVEMRLASASDSPLRRLMLRRIHRGLQGIEQKQLAQCDHVWVAKADDLARVGHERASVLPNIPFVEDNSVAPTSVQIPSCCDSRVLLTVGMLSHIPNVQGIDAFVTESWPAIARRVPGAEYHIVGSRLDPKVRSRWKSVPGVRVVGFVQDLQPCYAAAAATVCPVPWGGGTNIKVAESLAYGRPALLSAAAHRGWETIFPENECVYVARTAAEFVRKGIALLEDGALREQMGKAGRAAVQTNLDFSAFCKAVWRPLEQLGSKGNAS
jgi:glycosyltransferase involved in cell wall biosynthesis